MQPSGQNKITDGGGGCKSNTSVPASEDNDNVLTLYWHIRQTDRQAGNQADRQTDGWMDRPMEASERKVEMAGWRSMRPTQSRAGIVGLVGVENYSTLDSTTGPISRGWPPRDIKIPHVLNTFNHCHIFNKCPATTHTATFQIYNSDSLKQPHI